MPVISEASAFSAQSIARAIRRSVCNLPLLRRCGARAAAAATANERVRTIVLANDLLANELSNLRAAAESPQQCRRASKASILSYGQLFKGQSCVIVGNGPSVDRNDLNRLARADIVTFACNKFYMSYGSHELQPTFTLACDRQVIQDSGEKIVSECASQAVFFACDADLECPYGGFTRLVRQEFTLEQQVVFCATPLFGIPSMGSVVIFGIQLAYFMGFDAVYLYGIDHDFHVVRDPKSTDPWRQAVNDNNHFIPNYREGAPWAPPSTDLIEAGFLLCQERFDSESKRLINVSRKTQLPHIPRAKFESLFAAAEHGLTG